jgi:hypothetical protein
MVTTELLSEVKVNIRDSSKLEYYLRSWGFNYSIHYESGKKAVVVFENEEDATAFILRGILDKLKDNTVFYSPEAEFEFMIRLEKKLKSFSKADEYILRRLMKEK